MSNVEKSGRITERVTIAGTELVDFVKGLIEEGKIRRLIIRKPGGDVLLELSLSAGIAIGGALIIVAPILAALGAMAALVAKIQVEIIRREERDND